MESTVEKVGVRELLEAGVHFGHQAKRWNPRMKKYIFAERAGVHIIDLDQTLTLLQEAQKLVRSVAEAGREVLFVGTKKQAQLTLAEQAMRSGQPYVAERYIGGMLTNFQTIKPRIEYFKGLVTSVEETPEEARTGRDWFALNREYQKLRRNFAGLTEMERLPGAVFIVDPKREELLVKEANRLKIPVVALTDTNCDPEVVDYVIPGNDDAIRAINLISRLMANAVLEGSGADEVPTDDRPVPPVVEEARLAEEALAQSATDAAESAEVTTNGSADPAAEAPAAEAPATEEPVAEAATPEPTEEPVVSEPAVEEPAVEESAVEEPAEAGVVEEVEESADTGADQETEEK
ncbi:MAG: 30S ribosomal protein S2 [Actinomycetota bacterium]|nr:30S ribosomal protein S2 [Actinomycetota bacterium]